MKIYIKCFANLAKQEVCDYRKAKPLDLLAGQTVSSLLEHVGVTREAVKIAFVNNRHAGMDQVLHEGDRVALAPAVGGM